MRNPCLRVSFVTTARVPEEVAVGPPVTRGEFFDREGELDELARLLGSGASVLITAPRRIGKTSLLLEFAGRHDEEAFLFVDVQAHTDEAGAILKLAEVAARHREVRQVVADAFKNVLGAVSSRLEEVSVGELSLKLREGIDPDWRSKADDIFERLAQASKPVVVAFDELPILVSSLLCGDDGRLTPQRTERTRVFLSWLREATIRLRPAVRFIATGSIGLEPLLTRAGISEVMTTFTPLEVKPWDEATARLFIEDRAGRAGITMGDGAVDRQLGKLKCFIPHHVAMFVRFLLQDCRRRGAAACRVGDVDRVYREQMLSVHGHVELATYEDRLKRGYRRRCSGQPSSSSPKQPLPAGSHSAPRARSSRPRDSRAGKPRKRSASSWPSSFTTGTSGVEGTRSSSSPTCCGTGGSDGSAWATSGSRNDRPCHR